MTPAPASSQEVALTRRTAVRLGRAIRNFATSEVGGRAAALAGVLLTLLLAINGLNVVNSYVGRYEPVALLHREALMGARLRRHVGALVGNLKRIIAVNRPIP